MNYSVSAIVSQLRCADAFLSNSGKGDKEVFGRVTDVRQSVRGLSLSVTDRKGVVRVVAWRVPPAIAAAVCEAVSEPVPVITESCPDCGSVHYGEDTEAGCLQCDDCGYRGFPCDLSEYLSAIEEFGLTECPEIC